MKHAYKPLKGIFSVYKASTALLKTIQKIPLNRSATGINSLSVHISSISIVWPIAFPLWFLEPCGHIGHKFPLIIGVVPWLQTDETIGLGQACKVARAIFHHQLGM
jgi:hypothetical protein